MGLLGQGDGCYMLKAAFVAGVVSGTPTRGTTSGPNVISIETITQTAGSASYCLFTDGTLDGDWLIEISNDFARAGMGGGSPPTAGDWSPAPQAVIDADGVQQPGMFVPNVKHVQHGVYETQHQFVQAPACFCRAIRVTFKPSAGTGNATAAVAGGLSV